MTSLAFTRRGRGPTLVLLHGLGSARRTWDPIIPALAEGFDVVAVDLPGFGESDPLPADVEPLPAALAASVAKFLDELGIAVPHLVGNSLGGWVALELAGLRQVALLTLLSPAGLWRRGAPWYDRVSFRMTRWLAKHATESLSRLVKYRLGRILVLSQMHARPSRVDPEYARAAIRDMASCPGFDATLRATRYRRYRSGPAIEAPVTVAFGSRDFVLLAHQSRHLDELPPTVRMRTLAGCGHVPMPDDPDQTVAVITSTAIGLASGVHQRPRARTGSRNRVGG